MNGSKKGMFLLVHSTQRKVKDCLQGPLLLFFEELPPQWAHPAQAILSQRVHVSWKCITVAHTSHCSSRLVRSVESALDRLPPGLPSLAPSSYLPWFPTCGWNPNHWVAMQNISPQTPARVSPGPKLRTRWQPWVCAQRGGRLGDASGRSAPEMRPQRRGWVTGYPASGWTRTPG